MARRISVFLVVCAISLAAAAAPARADLLADMFKDYTQDGRLDPCSYTEKQLRQLKDLIPNDIAQYSDFGAAVDDALAKRAQGACSKGGSSPSKTTAPPPATGAAPTPPPPAASTGAPSAVVPAPGATAPAQPPPAPGSAPAAAPDVAAHDAIGVAARSTEPATDAPFPLLALAVLAALLAMGLLTFGLVRWRAWEPVWAERFRHAAGEAGWRASTTWADFTDFVRLGR